MKKINIFIASSIVEFAMERMQIELFIRNVSDKFEDRYNVKLQPILCENLDDVYSVARKQEEYNGKIRESEFCFFIFFTKAGKYTREEFDVARKQFEETGKPKIYTYFKVIEEGVTAEQSVRDFMYELDHTFGHYYGSFSHVDTLKLRILLSLKLQEMDFLEIKTEGGQCIVDGREVLKLDNVSEFANNRDLTELQRELAAVEAEYYDLRVKYDRGNCTDEIYRKYCAAASKRQNLIDEIDDLQRAIFNVSLRMVNDDVHGEIFDKQKKAYKLFEAGDHEGALSILNSEDIDNEFLRRRQRRHEEDIADCKKYIKEHKTAIDILQTMKKYDGRFAEIEERYEKIVPVIFEMNLELDTAYAYVDYLVDQNKDSKALPIAEKLLDMYEDDVDKAKVLNALGIICNDLHIAAKTDEYYLKAIAIYERLTIENPDRFEPDLATSYNNAGVFYSDQSPPTKAEEYYLKAIAIREKLARENPDRFEPDLATSYNNTGVFYQKQGHPTKAEEYYLKAIAIYEKLARENPDRFEPDLATSYSNAGVFYSDQRQPTKAEEYYLKAIGIREKLARENPDRFEPDLAQSYNNAGIFYDDQEQSTKAEDYFLKAIAIREKLARENPDRFEPNLADSYNNAGVFYKNQGQPTKAEEYYFKAIVIYEKLARENPDRFEPSLATSYNNAGVFYSDQGLSNKAEDYYLKAIAIREKLARENPDRFEPDLALCYLSFVIFKNDVSYLLKALELAKEYPDHPTCKKIIDALS